jgi:hypothetical protein
MPRAVKPAPVETRQLAPEEAEDKTLHEPVPQLDGTPKFKIKYVWFDPEKANEWLRNASQAEDFRQRPIKLSQVRRWKNLHTTKRFVHFLPNQAICTDEHGVMLNGQHRLTGLAGCPEGTQAGFMVIENVPRWMFAFFDTNSVRTIKDVFHIGNRASRPQTSSGMRLAMRYEEFLKGLRRPTGWRHWNVEKDEHNDIDNFYEKRDELQDWYASAEKLYKRAKILIPSTMVFRFYQQLAWPEGDEQIEEFCEQLYDPYNVPPLHPAKQLRDWSFNAYVDGVQVQAKRETQLMLLFKTFAQAQTGSRSKLTWAYGQPMTMPYHPKGHEVAVKNVRIALDDIDAEVASRT